MPSYSETIGDQLKRMRLGPTFVRRGKRPKGPSKPMPSAPSAQASQFKRYIGPTNHTETSVAVPGDVLADRDRRLAMAPRSLTAALLGDPPTPDWHKRP